MGIMDGVVVTRWDGMKAALLALNRDSAPWRIIDGAGDGTDLVVEWRLGEPRWTETFARAGMRGTVRVLLLLDEGTRTVRTWDEPYDVVKEFSGYRLVPTGTGAAAGSAAVAFGSTVPYSEKLPDGQAMTYRFASEELKDPLAVTVGQHGWHIDRAADRVDVSRSAPPGSMAAANAEAAAQQQPQQQQQQQQWPPQPQAQGSSVALVPAAPVYNGQAYPPPYQMPPQQLGPPGNPLAIAGFVCGLLGLTPFWVGFTLCILAIVFSSIALSKAPQRNNARKGLAIAGLVLGLVFIVPAACGL
jgi:hypothetical protein